ncbi:protein PRY2 [Oryza sativa Japonica Group]|uniref:Os12g0633400 protein n=3 Tax=Oryza TaxID=4527 RepID=Q2QLQ1_ORYSJ|nr:protein PRY2 [Oryza sativa Japonica Group]ABA99946.1 SCP-like extracellular protein, expressed [Oryza sativa Japonica Group]BAF30370.1 Os12g0633400 [Oryza sativa Japonica Group]BAG94842.1 unnamed protein product [Oryza sativa Japonica Group]BAT18232.1 Os12g0633400 [Oryza sativa Japonica Group]|eukprot:NP_001067351.1 Os12g0633400 [Oryza sativa Japonica Group]
MDKMMRTVIAAVVVGLLAAAHTATTAPEQSYGGATATVAPKQPAAGEDVNKALAAETAAAEAEDAAEEEDAAAALVTGFTAGAANSAPGVTAVMKPVLEKADAGQFYQDVPWIPDPNDEGNPPKSLPAAQVLPAKGGAGAAGSSPPSKEVQVDYYATTQPKKPEEPPTVAAVQKDNCVPPAAPKPAVPATPSTSPPSNKEYAPAAPGVVPVNQPSSPAAPAGVVPAPVQPSSPAAPAGVVPAPVQPSSPATAVPKPPSNDPYAPATSNTPAAEEQKDGLNEKAISDIVREHNMFRTREHVPPIVWNATLAKYAQEYADLRRGDCQLEHSHGPYGENMMFGTGKQWTWKKTVDEWSDEKKSYDYKSNSCKAGAMCTHYTAIVWKNTTAVGCGRVVCTSGDTIMVCSYWPPGNYVGVKPY